MSFVRNGRGRRSPHGVSRFEVLKMSLFFCTKLSGYVFSSALRQAVFSSNQFSPKEKTTQINGHVTRASEQIDGLKNSLYVDVLGFVYGKQRDLLYNYADNKKSINDSTTARWPRTFSQMNPSSYFFFLFLILYFSCTAYRMMSKCCWKPYKVGGT